jgi:hypothetical protein
MCETKTELLRLQFSHNKEIPKKYEVEILCALSHYPELRDTHIHFMLAVHAPVPYGTKPSFASCFKAKKNRVYTITILEYAELPEREALMKHLNSSMRIGVLGHELAHVVQFERCNPLGLLKTLSKFAFSRLRRQMETGADKGAIRHGLGWELLEHARFIRTIPGYVQQRPKLNEDYLLPHQIEFYLEHPEKLPAAS